MLEKVSKNALVIKLRTHFFQTVNKQFMVCFYTTNVQTKNKQSILFQVIEKKEGKINVPRNDFWYSGHIFMET